ncbi:MAG: hypothetical protein LCH81_07410 [Bacteroidetes bacterium]|nr:hypothetical protein [Bacteroidota bacterium]
MKWIFLPALLMCLSSCTVDPQLLGGAWRVSGYYQNGQSVAAALDSVQLEFQPDKTYAFKSIGYYRESGTFRTSGNYLFLTDTTASAPKERALKILYLSKDTLKIVMQRDSLEQVLFFTKL